MQQNFATKRSLRPLASCSTNIFVAIKTSLTGSRWKSCRAPGSNLFPVSVVQFVLISASTLSTSSPFSTKATVAPPCVPLRKDNRHSCRLQNKLNWKQKFYVAHTLFLERSRQASGSPSQTGLNIPPVLTKRATFRWMNGCSWGGKRELYFSTRAL